MKNNVVIFMHIACCTLHIFDRIHFLGWRVEWMYVDLTDDGIQAAFSGIFDEAVPNELHVKNLCFARTSEERKISDALYGNGSNSGECSGTTTTAIDKDSEQRPKLIFNNCTFQGCSFNL